MNILQCFTAKLTSQQLTEIIEKAVAENHPGFRVKKVTYNASLVNDYYMDRGPGTPTFTGVSIDLEKNG
jgi:hypothetical protein